MQERRQATSAYPAYPTQEMASLDLSSEKVFRGFDVADVKREFLSFLEESRDQSELLLYSYPLSS